MFFFILIYFSSIVKQAFFCLCKSRSNPFLEPTSTPHPAGPFYMYMGLQDMQVFSLFSPFFCVLVILR